RRPQRPSEPGGGQRVFPPSRRRGPPPARELGAMRDRGISLVEVTISILILLVMAAVAVPMFRARFADAHLVGAGEQFKARFRLAHSMAVRSGVYTAIRFDRRDDGAVTYAIYADGNYNGVLSADIARGKDRLVEGPIPLTGGIPGVFV